MNLNEKIKKTAKRNHVYYWQIALSLGIAESTIYRWLRTPLTDEREKAILNAIDTIAKEVANGDK